MHTTLRSVRTLVLLTLLSIPAAASAGGAPASCRPIRVPLPAVIAEEGVHCLTGNIATAMRQGVAIWIQSDNVVLDLNGFILEGLADRASTTALGIFAGGQQNVTVRNGTVRGFYVGINVFGLNTTVEGIRADRNTFMGISVIAAGAVIRGNHVIATGGTGIPVAFFPAARGIHVTGPAPRILNNDVTGIPDEPSARATGIALVGVGGLVVNNRIVSVERGIEFAGFVTSDGKYRDNLTYDVAVPYTGGIDAGNNH
jgi:hypothetical protein